MKKITEFKDLIIYKANADLRSEARRFYISYLWWIIEPILDMLVYYLVFAILLHNTTPNYVQFLLIGITMWKWFGATVLHSSNSIMQGKGLMLQVYLPKPVFPSIVILTDTFKFFIVFLLLLSFLWFSGFPPSQAYAFLPIIMLAEFVLVIAFSFLTAAITPFFPDLSIVIQHVMQILFFVSGIFFDVNNLSPRIQFWLTFNPMTVIISAYRDILMHHNAPPILIPLLIIAVATFITIMSYMLMMKFDKQYPRIVT